MELQAPTDQNVSPEKDFQEFLKWEKATRDTLDVKRVYIDMVGDLAAGVILSEIVYWHLPNTSGHSRMRVEHDGHLWIATRRYEWWDRCRLSPDQADYALRKLAEKDLIEKRVFKFGGQPTVHIRLRIEKFLAAFRAVLEKPVINPYFPKKVHGSQGDASEIEFGNFRNGNGTVTNSISDSEQKPLTETLFNSSSPPPATVQKQGLEFEDDLGYPNTLREAAQHPDLILFQRIANGLMPGKTDWRVIIDRMQFLRQKHPDLDDEQLVQAGKFYWLAWTARNYSPTHPDFMEWWMNEMIPPQKNKRKKDKASAGPTTTELEALRKRGAEVLGPLIAQSNPQEEKEVSNGAY